MKPYIPIFLFACVAAFAQGFMLAQTPPIKPTADCVMMVLLFAVAGTACFMLGIIAGYPSK